MKDYIKAFEKKYKGLRYSNLTKNRNNTWWFTIPPNLFADSLLYLMLINKVGKNSYIIKINTANQLKGIIARNEGVHLSGTYDLYFTLKDNAISIKYITDKGYKIEDFTKYIIETIDTSYTPCINNIEDLRENLLTIECYLDIDCSDKEQQFALSLIQKGRNLVAYKVNNEFHFAPSRFVGYKSNNMEKHQNNLEKDGRETTPIIDAISRSKLSFDKRLEKSYITYCNSLGITLHDNKRQYWFFDFSETSFEKLITSKDYKEGRVLYIKHRKRERNRKLVEDAKTAFRSRNNNKLFCEVCKFNFGDVYGIDYIEVHHIKAISEMQENETTKLEDVCLVCSNCHRVIHSRNPHLSVEEIKSLLRKE